MIPRNALAGPEMPPSPSGQVYGAGQRQMAGPQPSGDPLSALEQGIQLARQGQISKDDFLNLLMSLVMQLQQFEAAGEPNESM